MLTGKAMKAYKSLEAYKYFVIGKVQDILVWTQPSKRNWSQHVFVILSKVTHSMNLGEPAVRVRVALQESGSVITGHCTCMAGTSEVCSHVTATLFVVRKESDVVRNRTCTSMPCEWNKPGKKKQEQFSEAREINFSKPKPTS
ncbi:hypothetical protein Pcinc_002832 [Petrolisthes cinctipes]|uniref:SWIM-type domain-containing protein n=1 Tax=Petrolisthes cinctipes TaxID=88211 RepID=A0AAE1GII8_PETCI|nr:hypothetical protein Pcinc_002832 [Petrolisthes cinctipes]